MKSALWAKLITPIIPNTSVRPVATRTRLTPTVRPISSWVRIASSDTSGDSEVARLHAGVGAQRVGRAGELDAALVQHVAAAGQRERHLQILLDQQDRDALGVDRLQHPGERLHHQR